MGRAVHSNQSLHCDLVTYSETILVSNFGLKLTNSNAKMLGTPHPICVCECVY